MNNKKGAIGEARVKRDETMKQNERSSKTNKKDEAKGIIEAIDITKTN